MSAKKTLILQDSVSDDLNYEIWAPITKAKLLEKGLWDVVEYGIPPVPSKIQAEEISELRYAVGKDTEALTILRSSLPDSVFKETLKTTSAKDLWDLLKETYEEAKLEKKKIKRENASLAEYAMLASDADHLTFDKDMWMISITTTNHMIPYVKFFTTLDRTYRARVELRYGDTTMVEGIGDVRIRTKEGTRTITNVLYVPSLDKNVLSVPQLMSLGYQTTYGANWKCTIKDESGRLFAESWWHDKKCFVMHAPICKS